MKQLETEIKEFIDKHQWRTSHLPEKMNMVISEYNTEFTEIFKRMSSGQNSHLSLKTCNHIKKEIDGIMIYLTTGACSRLRGGLSLNST